MRRPIRNMSCLRSAQENYAVTRRGWVFSLATSIDFGAQSSPPIFRSAPVVVFFHVYKNVGFFTPSAGVLVFLGFSVSAIGVFVHVEIHYSEM